jgi:hypothetical protein
MRIIWKDTHDQIADRWAPMLNSLPLSLSHKVSRTGNHILTDICSCFMDGSHAALAVSRSTAT